MRGLHASVASQLSEAFLRGTAPADVKAYVQDVLDREVDLAPAKGFIDDAMKRFASEPTKSDSWLAPRLHYALRLTRREAAERSIWRHLAIVEFPDYIRWRWTGKKGVALDRLVGPEYKHALGRLWWGAELGRNGRDYATVVKMFEMQDVPNNLQRMNLFHNRPMAVASVRFLATLNNGSNAVGDDVNTLSKALNLVATTTVLDAIAPDAGPDPVAIADWVAGRPDETRFRDDLPEGPDEDPIGETAIDPVVDLVLRVASTLPLRAHSAAATASSSAAAEATTPAEAQSPDPQVDSEPAVAL